MTTPSEQYYQALLVISNLAFTWPVVEGVLAGEYVVAVMLSFTELASTAYHTCLLVDSCHYGGTFRTLDFIFATYVICLTALYWSGLTNIHMIGYSDSKYGWAVLATQGLLVVCLVAVLFGNFDTFVYMAAILASLGLIFIRFVIFAPADDSDSIVVRGIYRVEYFIFTGILGALGILLFFADNWISFDAYDETHPFWHIFIATSIGLTLRGVRYRQSYDRLFKWETVEVYRIV